MWRGKPLKRVSCSKILKALKMREKTARRRNWESVMPKCIICSDRQISQEAKPWQFPSPTFFFKLLPWQPLTKLQQSHYIAGAHSAFLSLSARLIYSGEQCRWRVKGYAEDRGVCDYLHCPPGWVPGCGVRWGTSSPYALLLSFINFPSPKCYRRVMS